MQFSLAETIHFHTYDYGYDFNIYDSVQDSNGNLSTTGTVIYTLKQVKYLSTNKKRDGKNVEN